MSRVKRKYTTLFHICIWSILFLCIFLIRQWNHGPREGGLANSEMVFALLPYIALFYVHGYWLMPAYLYRQKKHTYILMLAGLLVVVIALAGFVWHLEGLPSSDASYLRSVTKRIGPAFLFLLISAGVGNFREGVRQDTIRKEKETEHLRTELSFLRTQVNPHFMLNVLNSMVLLARKKSDLLEPVLLELSRL
ncbi:MAG TPA: histidine kinase, partial [Puia sp.]|nr:histidine kinase [Puia sp.]